MPTNVTPVPTWSTVIPVPADGEGATAASIHAFVQPLANRSQWTYSLITGTGVQRFANADDITALKALTGMAHKDARVVIGYGMYLYDSGSSATEDLPWIVQPTTGGGRWRLAGSLLPFQSRHLAYRSFSNALLHTATAPTSAWSTAVGLPLILPAGVQSTDIIEVAASIELASAGTGSVSVCVGFAGSSVQTWDDSIRTIATATRTRIELLATRDASGLSGSTTTPLQVGIYVKPNGSDDALLYGPGTFRVRVTRP